jgi:hypothetical protein
LYVIGHTATLGGLISERHLALMANSEGVLVATFKKTGVHGAKKLEVLVGFV